MSDTIFLHTRSVHVQEICITLVAFLLDILRAQMRHGFIAERNDGSIGNTIQTLRRYLIIVPRSKDNIQKRSINTAQSIWKFIVRSFKERYLPSAEYTMIISN